MDTNEQWKQYSHRDLYDALDIVAAFTCNNFVLDCTNGMSLRNVGGRMLAGGVYNVANRLYAEKVVADCLGDMT